MITDIFLPTAGKCWNYVYNGIANSGLFPLAGTHLGYPLIFFIKEFLLESVYPDHNKIF